MFSLNLLEFSIIHQNILYMYECIVVFMLLYTSDVYIIRECKLSQFQC